MCVLFVMFLIAIMYVCVCGAVWLVGWFSARIGTKVSSAIITANIQNCGVWQCGWVFSACGEEERQDKESMCTHTYTHTSYTIHHTSYITRIIHHTPHASYIIQHVRTYTRVSTFVCVVWISRSWFTISRSHTRTRHFHLLSLALVLSHSLSLMHTHTTKTHQTKTSLTNKTQTRTQNTHRKMCRT